MTDRLRTLTIVAVLAVAVAARRRSAGAAGGCAFPARDRRALSPCHLSSVPLVVGWRRARPTTAAARRAWRARGLPAALGLGLIFGLALGPCTFAYMAPMLGVVFEVGRASVGYGLLLIGAYGVGHCAVIVAAGTTTEWVSGYLRWHERARAGARLRHACGVLVLGGGLWFIYTA